MSRLTMENMNLASRCRDAISQVAALKKEILIYQKRQIEWGTLQREVMLLRKQIDRNAAEGRGGGGGRGGGQPQRRDLRRDLKRESPTSLPGSADGAGDNSDGSRRSASPGTELDRIMLRQF